MSNDLDLTDLFATARLPPDVEPLLKEARTVIAAVGDQLDYGTDTMEMAIWLRRAATVLATLKLIAGSEGLDLPVRPIQRRLAIRIQEWDLEEEADQALVERTSVVLDLILDLIDELDEVLVGSPSADPAVA